LMTHQLILSSGFYNLGAMLLFMSIWLNGSFIYLLNKVRSKLRPGILN